MNDRYLFRAKRIYNGEWTYGYIYGIWERKYILWGMTNDVPNMTEVDPSTICQCTGIKDKNGKRIWENDILMAHLDESCPEDATYETVEWGVAGWVTHESGSTDREYLDEFDLKYFEVVGNIYDNKELLQEETK